MIGLALLLGLASVWMGSLIVVLFVIGHAPRINGDEQDTTERSQDAPGTDAFFEHWGDW
ncbi:hypothetical protein [Stieleria magnilauensis]|uniref:Uncharacterized protein n=1 Tax=Stieleria magnilauensis TaxID=2527963 RepID=A0ABX5XT99_9BACT|nr:hypothetical protein TBK1r_39090 [Planctomycetes bacterium TBK1r]